MQKIVFTFEKMYLKYRNKCFIFQGEKFKINDINEQLYKFYGNEKHFFKISPVQNRLF
jgi:hypothetical protein